MLIPYSLPLAYKLSWTRLVSLGNLNKIEGNDIHCLDQSGLVATTSETLATVTYAYRTKAHYDNV
jgi:hypothetical protein